MIERKKKNTKLVAFKTLRQVNVNNSIARYLSFYLLTERTNKIKMDGKKERVRIAKTIKQKKEQRKNIPRWIVKQC